MGTPNKQHRLLAQEDEINKQKTAVNRTVLNYHHGAFARLVANTRQLIIH